VIIKFKILEVQDRALLVNFFTDAMLANAEQVEWPKRQQELINQHPEDSELRPTPEEALAKAKEVWPAGTVVLVEFPDDPVPTGDELRLSILKQAPWSHLARVDKALTGGAVDFSAVGITVGAQLQGTLDEAMGPRPASGIAIKIGAL
jgi:hypothetical protein